MKISPIKTIQAALTDRLHIDARRNPVRVTIEGNCVVMEGVVDSIALKKRALLAAMGIKEVEGVIDRLRVRPSSRMSDAEITAHIYDALGQEQTLGASGLKVEARDGVIDLEGAVGSLTHKRLAGVIAWWVPGVVEVINSIEVDPAEDDSDDEIVDAVRLILEKDPLVRMGSINVSAKNWIVTLSGSAISETEKIAAEEDAFYTWGVNEVVNAIELQKHVAKPPEKQTYRIHPYRPHRLPLKKPD